MVLRHKLEVLMPVLRRVAHAASAVFDTFNNVIAAALPAVALSNAGPGGRSFATGALQATNAVVACLGDPDRPVAGINPVGVLSAAWAHHVADLPCGDVLVQGAALGLIDAGYRVVTEDPVRRILEAQERMARASALFAETPGDGDDLAVQGLDGKADRGYGPLPH